MDDAPFYVLPVRLTIHIWTVMPASYRYTGQVLLDLITWRVQSRPSVCFVLGHARNGLTHMMLRAQTPRSQHPTSRTNRYFIR